VQGFLLAPSRLSEAELRSIGERSPVVLFNREVPGFRSVIVDSVDGSRQIVEHLAALGHRSIAYLAGPHSIWSDGQRWLALSATAERLGLDIVRVGPFDPTLDQGVAAADVGLRSGATAFVAFNDLMAIGVLRRLRQRGVDVPGSVSVVGYDDIFGADFCQPSLTTVVGAPEHAGRTLVDLALGRIASRPDTPITIPTQLLVRDSTGPVR
jgi:DNA-binding LacI/PurR family transcriptional regulator